ncbi:MAG: hypothetical protein INR62_07890 [Rhodospirillales bacterium]|nr:hypothetical protein [Acetobacter sp.]
MIDEKSGKHFRPKGALLDTPGRAGHTTYMLHIVAATRDTHSHFQAFAPLAKSTKELGSRGGARLYVAVGSTSPLPDVFNGVLAQVPAEDTILFTHDDVWIEDWFLSERLTEALSMFDVVGVAGNRRRIPRQPSWAFPEKIGEWDDGNNLSGAVAHGDDRYSPITNVGPTPQQVKLIDGVFIAARVQTLRSEGITFDPQFRFHFYDLDFCRNCERAGLKIGTWPIAITHRSLGNFGSPEWHEAYRLYLTKWGE